MSSHPRMKAVSAPKKQINLRDRLCFYRRKDNNNDKATDMRWPAVWYENLQEYFEQLKDEMSEAEKSTVAMQMMTSFKNGEGGINILRPLGKRSFLDYIRSVEGNDIYFDYTSSICHALNSHAGNPNAFTSDQEYLLFMDALSESEVIFRGPEFPIGNEASWSEYGLRTLGERADRVGHAASSDNDAPMTQESLKDLPVADKESRTIDFQEVLTPKNTGTISETAVATSESAASQDTDMEEVALLMSDEHEIDGMHAASGDNDAAMTQDNPEDALVADSEIRALDFQGVATPKNKGMISETAIATSKAAASQDTDMGEGAPLVSDEQETNDSHSAQMEEDTPCSVSESPALAQNDDAQNLEDTPRTNNHSSSSATVVSTDTNDDQSTVASGSQTPARKEPWPFQRPEVDESMDAQSISFQLIMVGWSVKVVDGKNYQLFPGVDVKNMKEGENAFLIEGLVDFVKKHNYFKDVSGRKQLFSPSFEAKPTEAQTSDEEDTQPLSAILKTMSPSKAKSKPTRRKKGKAKTVGVAGKKSVSAKHQSRQKVHGTRRTRTSPRRGSGCVTPIKTEPSDPFYEFKSLISTLRNHFNWAYKAGDNLHQWIYIRGDSELGRNGLHGEDFFWEEWEVQNYCMKHKYKERFDLLSEDEKSEGVENENGNTQEKMEVYDPNFTTPPPSRRIAEAQ